MLLKNLFESYFKEKVLDFEELPKSGSPRKYYRISSLNKTAIGAENQDIKENIAFLKFSEHFKSKNLSVPEIYVQNEEKNVYIQEDLGKISLFDFLVKNRNTTHGMLEIKNLYFKVVEELPKFQVLSSGDFNYEICYPRAAFDRQSMMWDLNYFKYFFLKLADIPFDEQALENDFHKFIDFLSEAEANFFMYRDFQSRNIIVSNGNPYFIDYQGGRKGALQYDLASLLYDSKADLSEEFREEVKLHYIKSLKKHLQFSEEKFNYYYPGFVLIRIMQAMGAYGFRGFFEQKEHFIASIPYAVNNVYNLLKNNKLNVEIPEIIRVLNEISKSEKLKTIGNSVKLTVTINSFSYTKGIPYDPSGNGGGFTFDCRFLNNPGRIEKYKALNGKDIEIIQFFEARNEAADFLTDVHNIVHKVINKYSERKYRNLSVNFGCTGGRHRSVYCAEKTAEYIKNNFDVKVKIIHTEGH